MKQGKTLQQLAAELERQRTTRRDFIAPTTRLSLAHTFSSKPGDVTLEPMLLGVNGPLGLNRIAHEQVAADLAIPKPYYDRMLVEAPELLCQNVNQWLRANPQRRMVRTLDGNVRAWLSDRYRALDNAELAEAVIPALANLEARVESCELTERRMYIKAVFPSISMDIAMAKREAMLAAGLGTHTETPPPDVLQAAVVIRNSEVGNGALAVEESVLRLVCYNLATVTKAVRRYHVGRKHAEQDGEDIQALMSDETRQAEDRAFFLKVRDTVRGIATMERLSVTAGKLAASAGDKIIAPVDEVVQAVAERYTLGDKVRGSVLHHLAEGGDLTRYGLVNALTRASSDVEDYDDATELERLGGALIELPRSEWLVLAKAA